MRFLHASIGVHDPERVARALAELFGARVYPFPPLPGATMVVSNDDHGTTLELYPKETTLEPGTEVDAPVAFGSSAGQSHGCHLLMKAPSLAAITAVAEREGWRMLRTWRGPPGAKVFELVELWIENHFLLELMTEEMSARYAAVAKHDHLDRILSA